ncbi:MAG TPA: hypothetical protein VNE82_09315, partial [Candidatus Binataceae bacterium]|nr:hypothetical protein [Candidatus Binataceae bacterium]
MAYARENPPGPMGTLDTTIAASEVANLSILPFRLFRQTRVGSPEAPIRAEIFSTERLEQHAESLAAAQQITANPKWGRPLAKRLYDNAKVLTETYRAIARTNSAHQP